MSGRAVRHIWRPVVSIWTVDELYCRAVKCSVGCVQCKPVDSMATARRCSARPVGTCGAMQCDGMQDGDCGVMCTELILLGSPCVIIPVSYL